MKKFEEMKIPSSGKRNSYWDMWDRGNLMTMVSDGVIQDDDGRQFFTLSAAINQASLYKRSIPSEEELEGFFPDSLPGYVRFNGNLEIPGTAMYVWAVNRDTGTATALEFREWRKTSVVTRPNPNNHFTTITVPFRKSRHDRA